ncbi:hypothetical protein ACFFRR_008196 [Megaselia abdita]
MVDPVDLQTFLHKIDGGCVAVDLCKIAIKHQDISSGSKNNKVGSVNFRCALDIEDCLDRFYGGYYSDWACGGQWNRAYQFVQLLANAFSNAHIEVIAFFDGTLKKNKKLDSERNDFRQKTISVLKHIRMIGTPPPKIWWLPPSGIRTVIRNSLRSVNIQVVQTVNDHTMEVIEYFHEQKLDALLGLHPDYIIANVGRYYSSHDLRLSYKGSLETKEQLTSKFLSSLSLTADHMPFVAVFLGGFIRLDETKMKTIHELLGLEATLDFEARIRKIAEIVRNSPTTDIDEFLKHLKLTDFENEIKDSIEYYQRRGKYTPVKKTHNKKQQQHKAIAVTDLPMPFASETNENDEEAKKILDGVNNLVDDGAGSGTAELAEQPQTPPEKNENVKEKVDKSNQPFTYALPVEVLKTALDRHQRGIMDQRLYQLLIKKEIILPQILEDEQYREIPSVHLFYRPARQMIYAIIFNLYHQKYLCSNNRNGNDKKDKKKDKEKKDKDSTNNNATGRQPPEILVAEWVWSPTNEYKKPDLVAATSLQWAVPTVQRLWFGLAMEDKQRRIRAFLSIMRSDSSLMLNRGYVPQHMLVLACVLRYIVTSPDRNILTRQELDAFLATAFSPQLQMVEATQKMVLPGVHLRGVYLATLFMQGVETASLANDACGVPLPWTMVNPWIFFDGKLFHLKLKMSTCVSTLRELCDDHIEIVLKIERFRKAILEDVDHYLLPAAHIVDPRFRPGFLQTPTTIPLTAAFGKNTAAAATLHPLAAGTNGAIFYNTPAYFPLSPSLLSRDAVTSLNQPVLAQPNTNNGNNRYNRNNRKQNQKGGYQLKVGGIVTSSWAAQKNAAAAAAAVASLSLCGPHVGGPQRISGFHNRGKLPMARALYNNTQASGGGAAANKNNRRNRNRNKRNNKNQKKPAAVASKPNSNKSNSTNDSNVTDEVLDSPPDNDIDNASQSQENTATSNSSSATPTKILAAGTTIDSISDDVQGIKLSGDEENDDDQSLSSPELQNGNSVLGSDLASQICNLILNDDDCFTTPSTSIQQQQPPQPSTAN